MRVVRRKLLVHPTQIENAIDLADQMVRWHHLVEIKRIEELDLDRLLADPSCAAPDDARLKPTESRFASRLNESFATQSSEERTFCVAVRMSA